MSVVTAVSIITVCPLYPWGPRPRLVETLDAERAHADHFCVWPPAVRSQPALYGGRMPLPSFRDPSQSGPILVINL